ncbi:hypothetical protein B0T14DRAFT_576486 [Immersiella caudata]|uniref:Uncharacterized protein n=1 Tax=Immersiella caudata TaxID=314043 RepID=A0AA40CE54_9PEZI|nr:hypothetical protein B0T14DRAFT_576486 [Immersiella caudata]
MENYIYRGWFRPYRTELNNCHLPWLCKFFKLRGLRWPLTEPSEIIDQFVRFNGAFCEHIARVRFSVKSAASENDKGQPSAPYFLKPIFRALLIICCCEDYSGENSKTVGRFPVYLVRTGIEDGLSSPVSFDSISGLTEECASRKDVVKRLLRLPSSLLWPWRPAKSRCLAFDQTQLKVRGSKGLG